MKKLYSILCISCIIFQANAQWNCYSPSAFGLDTVFGNGLYFYNQNNGFLIGGRRASDKNILGVVSLYRTSDGCLSWNRISDFAPIGMTGIAGKGSDTIVVGVGDSGVIRSFDNGLTWQKIFNEGAEPHLTKDGGLFLHTLTGIYLSTDFGNSFVKQSNIIPSPQYGYFKPINISTAFYFDKQDMRVYKSTDGCKSWNPCSKILADHGNTNFSYSFVSEDLMFAIVRNKMYRSTNSGLSWKEIKNTKELYNNNNGVHFINNRDGFYSIQGEVFRTNDTGNSWCLHDVKNVPFANISLSFPMFFVNDSVGFWPSNLGVSGEIICVTTNQGGPSCPTNSVFKPKENVSGIKVYPNPTKAYVTLQSEEFIMQTAQLYNVAGQKVLQQNINNKEATLSLAHLPKGLYLLKVYTENGLIYNEKVLLE